MLVVPVVEAVLAALEESEGHRFMVAQAVGLGALVAIKVERAVIRCSVVLAVEALGLRYPQQPHQKT